MKISALEFLVRFLLFFSCGDITLGLYPLCGNYYFFLLELGVNCSLFVTGEILIFSTVHTLSYQLLAPGFYLEVIHDKFPDLFMMTQTSDDMFCDFDYLGIK
jgi:hypothetical protein